MIDARGYSCPMPVVMVQKEVADKMAAAHKKHAVPPSPAAADAAAPSPTRGEGNN